MPSLDWRVEVDQANDADWSDMLELFDDANFYQTAAYGKVRWGEKNLSRIVVKKGGEVQGIAQIRIVRPTPLRFGMAYLRWGPIWERRGLPHDSEVPIRTARAIEDEYLRRRRLFLRILPNAFAGSPRASIVHAAFSRFAAELLDEGNTYRTFLLDLGPSLSELRKNFDPKWRNKLAGAEKNDLIILAGDGSAEYQSFFQMYDQMRKRKTFETTVDVEEFGRIQATLPASQRMRVLICKEKGVPVSGLVVSAMGDSAIYLLGATSDDGLKSKGAYLLHWAMIQWLKENGVRWYDLGGVDPIANPGGYSFKKGFSGSEICQVSPLVASESAVSSGIAKAGMAMQRTLRSSLGPGTLVRSLKRLTSKN
jgi:lipid II:glycine glycyltransferase (peptidoglycan interpeptide bridge formation enzyme)